MKSSIYNDYYKLGIEHFINKQLLGLHKPKAITNVVYFALMFVMILIAQLF